MTSVEKRRVVVASSANAKKAMVSICTTISPAAAAAIAREAHVPSSIASDAITAQGKGGEGTDEIQLRQQQLGGVRPQRVVKWAEGGKRKLGNLLGHLQSAKLDRKRVIKRKNPVPATSPVVITRKGALPAPSPVVITRKGALPAPSPVVVTRTPPPATKTIHVIKRQKVEEEQSKPVALGSEKSLRRKKKILALIQQRKQVAENAMIQTRAKPHVLWAPAQHNDTTQQLLLQSQREQLAVLDAEITCLMPTGNP